MGECASAQLQRAALPRRRRLRNPRGGGFGLKGLGGGKQRLAGCTPNALHLAMLIYGGHQSERGRDRTTNRRELSLVLTLHPQRPGQPDSLGGRGPELQTEGNRRMQTVQRLKRRSHPRANADDAAVLPEHLLGPDRFVGCSPCFGAR